MIARIKLWLALYRRKQARKVEQERAKRAYWAAQRRQWSRDPLRGRA